MLFLPPLIVESFEYVPVTSKGVNATVISKRDVPPKPILVSEDEENQSIYRYNYSGEPLE